MLDVRSRRGPAAMECPVDFLNVEGIRIEGSTPPVAHVAVLGMLGITQRLEEVVVAPDAANIFGRAPALPTQNDGIPRSGRGGNHGFKYYIMLPPVPKVILVHHSGFRSTQHLAKTNLPFVPDLQPEFPIGLSVERLTRLELMKMAIGPTHGDLQNVVKPLEGDVRRNLKPPSNGGPRSAQAHFELVDRLCPPVHALSSLCFRDV